MVRCAIVDAYGSGRLLPGALRRYGVDYVHIRSGHPDIRLDYEPDDFAIDIEHGADVAQTAAQLRRLDVGFVAAGTESGVLLADALSAALGTPGNGMRHPEARRDKYQMQMAVRAAGLATADLLTSASVTEIVSWARARDEWPVVLKPLSSAGADNVIVCASEAEIRAGFERIMASSDCFDRRNGAVLAQEYLEGEEYYVNTVSRDGVHRAVEIWHYHKRMLDGRRLYDHDNLVSHDDPAARQIVDYALVVLDALEIRNGAGHTEVMLTKDGPLLVECGARPAGGQMPELMSRCIGTYQLDLLAYSIARPAEFVRAPQIRYRPRAHLWCVNLISLREGTMPPADRWDQIRSLSSFADLVLNITSGSPLSRTLDLDTCPGYVYLSSTDIGQIEADYALLRSLEKTELYRA